MCTYCEVRGEDYDEDDLAFDLVNKLAAPGAWDPYEPWPTEPMWMSEWEADADEHGVAVVSWLAFATTEAMAAAAGRRICLDRAYGPEEGTIKIRRIVRGSRSGLSLS